MGEKNVYLFPFCFCVVRGRVLARFMGSFLQIEGGGDSINLED
jgi:hypothetical protein